MSRIPEKALKWRPIQGNLLLWGQDTGTGKTFTAAYIAGQIANTRTTFKFISVPGLIIKARSSWGTWRGEQSEEEIYRDLVRPEILILDDLGTEQDCPTSKQLLFALIDARWLAQKMTVYTSNLTLIQIVQRYGDKLASRIMAGIEVQYKGDDMRAFKP